jgi:histone H3/H4
MVTLSTIPNELHLEILRRLDVASILTMRLLNRHFRELIDTNEDTIVRGTLRNVECVGPHSILLQFYPLTTPQNCTLLHAKRILKTKTTILRVAKICRIAGNAKIDALYCIDYICQATRNFYPQIFRETNDAAISHIRHTILSPYTTLQLQHMLPICIRLVFKIAELCGNQFRGSSLEQDDYNRYSECLIANGLEIIVVLEEGGRDMQREMDGWWGFRFSPELPVMHEVLIGFLETRGSGLMTDPGIEIQQFFQEEDTYLGRRRSPSP